MTAKVLQGGIQFLGKRRAAGDIITDEELSFTTPQLREALVSMRVMEIEGMTANGTPGSVGSMSAVDKECLSALQASFDRFREDTAVSLESMHEKLDAALAGGKPAKRRKKG